MRSFAPQQWKYNEMTPKERMKALAAGEEIDRIPCCPLISEHACRLIGVTVSRYCHSSDLVAKGVIAVFHRYRPDEAVVYCGLHTVAEAMGTRLTFPEDDIPFVNAPFLKGYVDFNKLSPANPYRDGRLPLYLEALKLVVEKIGDEVGVECGVGGPFTTAAGLRGTENLLKDLYRNTEMVHRLMHLVTESILACIDAVCDLGLKPCIAEPTASGDLVNPTVFRQFVKPYLRKLADRIIERCGSGPRLHICGDTSDIWLDMAETGASILSLDHVVDLAKAKKVAGSRACLFGNVPPVETLMMGTRNQVHAEVRECLRKAYDSPKGYILSSGCAVPLDTPPGNIVALMDAARIYGRLPIDTEWLMWQRESK